MIVSYFFTILRSHSWIGSPHFDVISTRIRWSLYIAWRLDETGSVLLFIDFFCVNYWILYNDFLNFYTAPLFELYHLYSHVLIILKLFYSCCILSLSNYRNLVPKSFFLPFCAYPMTFFPLPVETSWSRLLQNILEKYFHVTMLPNFQTVLLFL